MYKPCTLFVESTVNLIVGYTIDCICNGCGQGGIPNTDATRQTRNIRSESLTELLQGRIAISRRHLSYNCNRHTLFAFHFVPRSSLAALANNSKAE